MPQTSSTTYAIRRPALSSLSSTVLAASCARKLFYSPKTTQNPIFVAYLTVSLGSSLWVRLTRARGWQTGHTYSLRPLGCSNLVTGRYWQPRKTDNQLLDSIQAKFL